MLPGLKLPHRPLRDPVGRAQSNPRSTMNGPQLVDEIQDFVATRHHPRRRLGALQALRAGLRAKQLRASATDSTPTSRDRRSPWPRCHVRHRVSAAGLGTSGQKPAAGPCRVMPCGESTQQRAVLFMPVRRSALVSVPSSFPLSRLPTSTTPGFRPRARGPRHAPMARGQRPRRRRRQRGTSVIKWIEVH